MLEENGAQALNEYQLFHGTKASTIDAICRRGFDWRFCGKHGTAYGQGRLCLVVYIVFKFLLKVSVQFSCPVNLCPCEAILMKF